MKKGEKLPDWHRAILTKSRLGKKHTLETRAKMSAAAAGKKRRPHTEATKAKLRLKKLGSLNPMFGKKMSQEMREDMSRRWKGRVFSLETRKKIGLANKGRKPSEATRQKLSESHKGQLSWNKGRTGVYSAETIERMRIANKGKNIGRKMSVQARRNMSAARPKGKDSWNWRGGVSTDNELARKNIDFRLWREAVFARDNWTCQKHKVRGGKLHPHHIINFAENKDLRYVVDNGVTLCEPAHREFHKKFGMSKNTREQINKYLEETA